MAKVGLGASLYFLVTGAFSDEKNAVLHGNQLHFSGERRRDHRMFLRRSVHRIEKGLISRPMRKSFAADYVEGTVDTYINLCSSGTEDWGELQWARDVLARFFEATRESSDDRIVRARRRWDLTDHTHSVVAEELSPFPYRSLNSETSFDGISEAARNRRSVRWFNPNPVPRNVIEKALEVGLTAPSACNRQSFRLELLEQGTLLDQVAAIPMGTAGFSHQIPLLGVLIGQHRGYEHHRDRHAIYVDGGLFATGFILSLESLGLSSCCINWPEIPSLNRRMSEALSLQKDERVIMLIAIGYGTDGQEVPRSHKRNMGTVVTWR
ncbi:nitroreductase family protein [Paenarthrobacter sp. NPDC092416]|uniref:nitroreductase family protein n=1 Tax=Paenarthrobacter sp. NPDC092416 TaxID=3364386 RepID=UPI00381F4FD7